MNHWPTKTLDAVLDDIIDRRGITPLKLGSNFTTAGHRVISAKLINDGTINLGADEPRFVDTDTYLRWMRSPLLPGDVLLTSEAPLGEIAYVRDRLDWCLGQRLFALRPTRAHLDGRFLYYALQSSPVRVDLQSRATGTTVQGIRQTELRKVSVPIPPLVDQSNIAAILGALDDKIELNRRMNQTLEAIAQAIFKSWFIDFEPARAKALGEPDDSIVGRFGIRPEVLPNFPNTFTDSGLGPAPAGWPISTLGEQARRFGGLIQTGPFGSQLHAADYVSEGIPVVMPQDLSDRRISTRRVARVTPEMAASLSRHALKPGDVVYSRRGDVERHALISPREAGWLCGTGCLLVRLGEGWPSQAYLSEVLNDRRTRDWIVRHAVGATMPNLNTSILSAVPVLIPPAPLLQHFEAIVGPMRLEQDALSAESDSLALLRDELLPKLLSGELSSGKVQS